MALLDTMENILDSLREGISSPSEDDQSSEPKKPAPYVESLTTYRHEILEHIAEQRKSVQEALPLVSATEVTAMRKKMDHLSDKLNRLKQELKDLEP